MKKTFRFVIFFVVSIIVVFFVCLMIKARISNNLSAKKSSIDKTWEKIVDINNRKISYIGKNVYKHEKDFILVPDNLNEKVSNHEYTFYLYELNKYLINARLDPRTKTYFISLDSISNKLIKKYNKDVLAFNKYASSFPIIIISRNKKYRTYHTLPIVFGQSNKDPKQSKKETIEWLREMEKNEGLYQ